MKYPNSEIASTIYNDMRASMKEKNTSMTNLLRFVLGEFDRVSKDLDDTKVVKVIKKIQSGLETLGTKEAYAEFNALEVYVPEILTGDKMDEIINKIIDANQSKVDAYRMGSRGTIGFFMSQAIEVCGSRGDNRYINEKFREILDK